jgi:hypothetical protein
LTPRNRFGFSGRPTLRVYAWEVCTLPSQSTPSSNKNWERRDQNKSHVNPARGTPNSSPHSASGPPGKHSDPSKGARDRPPENSTAKAARPANLNNWALWAGYKFCVRASRRYCHDSYRCARDLRCVSESRREVNIWALYLASTSDLTIHQVVRYSPDFYKPIEFIRVDNYPMRYCHDSYRCARDLRCVSESRREVNIWTPNLAATSDLTIHQVVWCIIDFYKPFEFMKVDHCPILPEPWHANCFLDSRSSRK